ncbi:MAG: iron ABC transporter permease [Alphaproteobacteria bacterium]|nr:iron ABC transporter permease [Alphaproteobacteria bacterium]
MKHFIYRNAGETVSMRFSKAKLVILAILLLVLVVMAAFAITLGDFYITIVEVYGSLLHLGDANKRIDFFVRKMRLPRALTAALVGGALGIAGAVFQRVVRNPLASPDILGITTGASLFAAAAIFFGFFGWATSLFAVFGSMLTAIIVYLLAYKKGASPVRLILVGVGITAAFGGGISYIVTRADENLAVMVLQWTTGSLALSGWDEVLLVFLALLILVPIILFLERRLSLIELGDDLAVTLGLKRETSYILLLATASILVGLAIAASGPIGFVALIAPHAARGIVGRLNGGAMLVSMFFGAILLLVSDMVAQHDLNISVPTGAITAAIGAPYFLFILYRGAKNGTI